MGSLQNLPEYGMMRAEDSRPQGGRREQTVAQNTKNVIRKGFIELLEQRSLDKISVVDIAEHCGINRNTFYYYYCDIYALIREILEDEARKVLTADPPCKNWSEVVMRVTGFIRANRRAVYHLYHSSQRELLEDHYFQVAYTCMESLVRRTAGDLPVAEEDVQTISALYTATVVGMLDRWLRYGMKPDAEKYIYRVGRLTEGSLLQTLERSCSGEGAL